MNSEVDHLSRAVMLFLSFGTASSPQQNAAGLVREFGEQKAMLLGKRVQSLVSEIEAIDVDWSKFDLASAGKMARAEMRARHPELTDEALAALEWRFTFSWK